MNRVLADREFLERWPNFHLELVESTEQTLLCAGLAAHQRILQDIEPLFTQTQQPAAVGSSKFSLMTIRPRIYGHTPIANLRALKQDTYNRLISVRGTVIRVNAPKIVWSWMAYRCPQCHCEQAIRQMDQFNATTPSSCKATGCRVRSNFQMLLSSPYTRTEPLQMIRLQESMQSAQYGSGQVPKSIEVELAYDLVDSVSPGDDVTVTGIIQVRLQEQSRNQRGAAQVSMHKFYIQGLSIVSNKNTLTMQNSDLTDGDLETINRIRNETNPLYLFVHSLCPTIFGHEMVKAGLILALFGGSGNGQNGNKKPGCGRRVETHVLVVGDPGIGKSHMLQACANVSPRGLLF